MQPHRDLWQRRLFSLWLVFVWGGNVVESFMWLKEHHTHLDASRFTACLASFMISTAFFSMLLFHHIITRRERPPNDKPPT